jgi:anti-sigma regulatory factor (Ser/Thr protein kinase)
MELDRSALTRSPPLGDPASAREWHGTIRGGDLAPGRARRALNRFAPALDPRRLAEARLALSEIVNNSVRHAGAGPDETIELSLSCTETMLHVAVGDHGGGFDPALEIREPDTEREGGRGLFLVDAVASHWGVRGDGPTQVWFELSL